MDRRFVDHVLSAEIVTRAEMQRLILQARKNDSGLVRELLAEQTVDEAAVAGAVASYYERPQLPLDAFSVDETATKLISADMARDNTVLPFSLEDGGDTVSIAIVDPAGAENVIEMLRSATGNEPQVWIAPQSFLDQQIAYHYFGEEIPNFPEFSAPSAGDSSESSAAPGVRDDEPTRRVPRQAGDEPSDLVVIDEPTSTKKPTVPPLPGPKGKALGRIKTARVSAAEVRKSREEAGEEREELEQALEEFDNFLDNSSNFLGAGPQVDDDADPFSLDEGADFGSFDLFGQEVGLDESTSVEDKIAHQEETIRSLVTELRRQRDIIQAMATILEEKGVLKKRDLKRRARGK